MLGDLDYAVKHLSDFHFRIVPVQHRSGMPSEAQHAELNSSLDTDLPSNDNSHVDGSHEHLRARIVATRIRQLDQSKLQSRPGDTAAESSRGRGQSVGSGGRRRRKRSRKVSLVVVGVFVLFPARSSFGSEVQLFTFCVLDGAAHGCGRGQRCVLLL